MTEQLDDMMRFVIAFLIIMRNLAVTFLIMRSGRQSNVDTIDPAVLMYPEC